MKNKLFKNICLLALGGLALTTSSCLKSSDTYVDFSKAGTLVELPLAGYGPNADGDKFVFLSYAATLPSVENPVVVNVASPKPLSTALDVTLKVDDAALTSYNVKHATTYSLLPATAYSIANLKVNIPANQRTANLAVTLKPNMITDFSKQYVLPITIVDASGQKISNYRTVYYVVGVKNAYDGKYTVTGSAVREGDPVLSGPFAAQEFSLITAGPYAVDMSKTAVWASGSGIGGIGPFRLTLNPTTNAITVTDAVNAAVVNNPDGINKYDPATKTFQISVYWGTGPTNRAWEAKFVYKSPR
jgi:hypothetical protein